MSLNTSTSTLEGKSSGSHLSVKEAAAYLRVSGGWLYGSNIPYAKLGRRRVYRRCDLDDYVRCHLSHGPERGSE